MAGPAQRLLRFTQLNTSLAPYAPILRLQEVLFEQRRRDLIPDMLLRLEHNHVYTMGKRGSPSDFHVDPATLAAAGAEVAASPRGGETTYHGPGQLVVYPLVSLRQLGCGARAYVEGLEGVMVATLGRYGISARGQVPGKTGVWVGERKVGAVGVRISQGVASHGVALNVTTDLSRFAHIVPCGTPDREVTSVQLQLAARHQQVAPAAQQQQRRQHGRQQAEAPEPGGAGSGGAAGVWVPQLCQVADDFLDAFAAHFGHSRLEQAPDVLQLAAELGCCGHGS